VCLARGADFASTIVPVDMAPNSDFSTSDSASGCGSFLVVISFIWANCEFSLFFSVVASGCL
jgi:hypothetical protein